MSNNTKVSETSKFDNRMHTYGRIWTLLILSILLILPIGLAIYYKATINYNAVLKGAISLGLIFIPSALVEVITYAPMLGTGGSYLAFITGNLTNLKIPCCMSARSIANTEFGTKENEIVSILSVAVSSLVSFVVIMLGVIMIVPLSPILESETLAPAFSCVVPALFGSLAYTYFKKLPKVVPYPLILMATACFIFPSLSQQIAILIPIAAIFSIGVARILYKKNKI